MAAVGAVRLEIAAVLTEIDGLVVPGQTNDLMFMAAGEHYNCELCQYQRYRCYEENRMWALHLWVCGFEHTQASPI